MNKYLISLLYFPLTFNAYCQHSLTDNFDKALKQLNIKREECYQELMVEQAVPYLKDKSVIVIPKIVGQEPGAITLDSYILIVDNPTGIILNTFYEKQAWTSDAVELERIEVDFAPYKLNSTVRAFGIRTKYHGSSRPNPYTEENISLFYPDNKQLIRVLKDFTVYSYNGEWDTNCEGEFETVNKLLIISDQKTNSLSNILAKVTYTTITQTLVNDDCINKEKVEKKTQVLTLKGKEYK